MAPPRGGQGSYAATAGMRTFIISANERDVAEAEENHVVDSTTLREARTGMYTYAQEEQYRSNGSLLTEVPGLTRHVFSIATYPP